MASLQTVSTTSTAVSASELAVPTIKALHFGAGNIGRGFIGKVLAEAGAKVVFADVVGSVIDRLNACREYKVRVVGDNIDRVDTVKNVAGLNSLKDDIPTTISEVDLVTTAVGPNIIPRLAAPIARGIRMRFEGQCMQPLNIICCENMVRATSTLKRHVMDQFDEKDPIVTWMASNVGFVDCAVDRIVPPASRTAEDPLEVTVEEFHEWIVDATQFAGKIPKISGMVAKENLEAFVERKLFTLNTGHAITSYLGYLKGHVHIHEAINDEEIRNCVLKAMRQSGEVLKRRYGFDADEHEAYIQKLIGRFRNAHLRDEVVRVAREPLRKLSPGDRLVKPLLGCLEYGLPYDGLAHGLAAALCYNHGGDTEAVKLQGMVSEVGVEAAFKEVSKVSNSDVIGMVLQAYRALN